MVRACGLTGRRPWAELPERRSREERRRAGPRPTPPPGPRVSGPLGAEPAATMSGARRRDADGPGRRRLGKRSRVAQMLLLLWSDRTTLQEDPHHATKATLKPGDGRGRPDRRRSCVRANDQSRAELGDARRWQRPDQPGAGALSESRYQDPAGLGHAGRVGNDSPQRRPVQSRHDHAGHDHAGNDHAGNGHARSDVRDAGVGNVLDAVGNARSGFPGPGEERPAGSPGQGHESGPCGRGHGTQDGAGGA